MRPADHHARTNPKVAAVGSPEDELFLQPWFLSEAQYLAVRRILPPSQMLKMRYYFDDYGCLKCGKLNTLYGSNGLCRNCSIVVRARVVLALKRRFKRLGVKLPKGPFERYLRRVFDREPKSRLTSSMCLRRAR
jgi:hypothetical protein